jgi:hypothetical protein
MINILYNFFDKLFIKWNDNQRLKSDEWSVDKVIDTSITSVEPNAKYFFLFNLFEKTLTEWSILFLKKVANYIRINEIDGRDNSKTTFKKDASNSKLDSDNLNMCVQADPKKIKVIKDINFKDVFDNPQFADNKIISQYMGISDLLKRELSILILTYGYSGSGKTFTIFGSTVPTTKTGMLQSILSRLGSGIEIKVKTFELYGLGVPYEFYWRYATKIKHWIYSYPFDNSDKDFTEADVTEINIDGFESYLKLSDESKYSKLEKNDIKNFSTFTQKIDKYRKTKGRIKKTKNNPASSRSIIVFDFLIIINNKRIHLVIMDLPGKEKIYETYCENEDIKIEFLVYFFRR